MKRLMILGAVCALAVARPELYKENEDFKFSRSSSDEGTKSGFYGAQRGNMGGNYERAHNMDSLAQNQMSGLVRQVEGELGDGARMRTGSVYSAANSRGTYGSGHFDLSNLAGRNFQEGGSYGDSQSQSSQSSSSAYNAESYANSRSQSSRHSGYQATGHSGLNLQSDNLQTIDNTQGTGQYDYGRHASHSAGYNAQSGYEQHSAYDTSNTNLHAGYGDSNGHTRLISATPVRIIVRPGTRVAIPVAAQQYDVVDGSSLVDHNSLNSDAEILNSDNQRTAYRPGTAKHYESSYNYRKQWEKHSTIPVTGIPSTSTDNPFPKNSELYEDSQSRTSSDQYDARRVDSQRAHSYTGYNANVKSSSGQSHYNYDTQHHGASAQTASANAYIPTTYGSNHQGTSSVASSNGLNMQTQYNSNRYHGATADFDSLSQAARSAGFNTDLNSQVENVNGKPKSYQSAYSYHKSWERQGDPYVIKPASSGYYDGQSPQRLTAGSTNNQGYLATGSHYQHSHQSAADCDENGHIRVARSYNMDQYRDTQQQSQNFDNFGQQVQDLGQQSQNLEYFGQQAQELGQQSQKLEDFSQQAQELGQQSQKLEDFSQQAQELGQQSQKLEDFSQQAQELGQQSQNLDFGQQVQELGQQSQNLEDFGQQAQQNLEDFGQQVQELGQQTQTQNTWDNLENLSQQSHNQWDKTQQTWDRFEDFGQQSQDALFSQFEQTNQTNRSPLSSLWDKLGNIENQSKFSTDNEDKHVEHDRSKLLTNTQHASESSSQVHTYNEDSISQEHLNSHLKPFPDVTHYNEQESNQNKSNTQTDKESSTDVGRGDIEPEDSSDAKPYKYPFDAPVVVTEQEKDQQHDHVERKNENTDQQKLQVIGIQDNLTPSISGDFNKQDHSEQHSFQNSGQDQSQDYGQHENMDHQKLEDFGQQDNLQQQNIQDIGQHENIEQQNLQDFGQQVNLDQQNLKDFGQQVNLEQQNLQDFGQQVNLEQQNLQDFGQQVNSDQQNLKDFGQHVNLEQQNLQDFGQQVNSDQQNLKDFGQHVDLEQQNLQDFGQQVNLEQQNLQDFGQQVNSDQQNLKDFGQHVNLEQQNLQDFGQQVNLEQQNLQDFGQQVNLEQQNLQDFGQQVNSDQQNLKDFGQQVNLEQQNLQDFGQQVNLEQQNLKDLGQQVNLEQQNLQDFGHFEPRLNKENYAEQSQSFDHVSVLEQHAGYSDKQKDQMTLPKNNGQPPPVEIEEHILKKQNDLHSIASTTTPSTEAPVEVVTEKAGFWKSIGNKFSSAKSKIASWF